MDELIQLRQQLHQYPELSGNEVQTADTIASYVSKYNPDKIIRNVGGNGIVVVYDSKIDGPTLLFRCELDALPIAESNDFEHKSKKNGISHKCGHDGHMAILIGLVKEISLNKCNKGKVILLFQPAEETGQGAQAVLNDAVFDKYKIDYVFALHNVPGYSLGSILCKSGPITPSVKSVAIKLHGKTSHAAEPENGINPATAISKIIAATKQLEVIASELCIITPVYINLGDKAYGISAGYGEIHFTVRCWSNDKMLKLVFELTKLVAEICHHEKLSHELNWFEEFHANINNMHCYENIAKAAEVNNYTIITMDNPFKWGEDFGLFTEKHKGALFGIGAGKNIPALHNPDYDFPDELISYGVNMFNEIRKQYLN